MYNIKTTPSKTKEVIKTNVPKQVSASFGWMDVRSINNHLIIEDRSRWDSVTVSIDFLREVIKEYDNCK